MTQTSDNKSERDPALWAIAQKRASFKSHLLTYIVINGFFWLLWYFNGSKSYTGNGIPWPVYPMLGWGIGLAFHFIGAYVAPKSNSVEKEYDRLTKNRNN